MTPPAATDPSRYPSARPPRRRGSHGSTGAALGALGWVGVLLVLGVLVGVVVVGTLATKDRIEFLLADKQPGVFTVQSVVPGSADEDGHTCTGTFAVHGDRLPGQFTYDDCEGQAGATYEVVHREGKPFVERGGAGATISAVVTIAFLGGSALGLVAFVVWATVVKPRRLRRAGPSSTQPSRTPPTPPRT